MMFRNLYEVSLQLALVECGRTYVEDGSRDKNGVAGWRATGSVKTESCWCRCDQVVIALLDVGRRAHVRGVGLPSCGCPHGRKRISEARVRCIRRSVFDGRYGIG